MTTARPFTTETTLSQEQLEIMYVGLPTKGRLIIDDAEHALIDAALAKDPDNYYLWCAKATQISDAAGAIACYSNALRIKPFASHTLYNRGRKMLGTEMIETAAADLRAATMLDSDEPWKWHFYGVSLYFLERFTDAADAFEQAIGAAQRTGAHLLPFEIDWMWNCHMKSGNRSAAAECLERVDAATPVLASEATYKHRILLYRGLITEAEFLAEIDREDAVEAANQLYGYANYLYYLKDDVAASVEVLKDVLETAPQGAGWGAKMAALDLPLRTSELNAVPTEH